VAVLLALSLLLAPTSLKITVWPQGYDSANVRRYTLACRPARGTVPRPARACTVLSRAGAAAFAPVPRDAACTTIWGGEAKARVRGRVGGVAVDARFNLENGCEIDRWNRLASVVPRPRS
jgi:subtilisin inhibitor-like